MKKQSSHSRARSLIACLLVLAMLAVSFPLGSAVALESNGDTLLEDVGFDASQIVLRLGALSDLHFTYSYDTVNSATGKIQRYADAVAALDKAADHQLDAILAAGDYTSTGEYVPAATFASAVSAVLDGINAGKPDAEKTRFAYAYGNHDTCWAGNMAISESSPDYAACAAYTQNTVGGVQYTWERLMNDYGLLAGQGAHIDASVAGEGCYWYEFPTAAGTYYVLSLETSTYAPNTYTAKALAWLDAKLAEITANGTGNKYVYIISHAMILESGVYGTDITLEKNTQWGAIDKDGALDAVLSKYPQVVYLSGHSHFSTLLESAIMSKNYTALSLSAVSGTNFSSDASDYLDKVSGGIADGQGVLIEVDADGNQRIRRVSLNDSTASMTLSTTGTTVPNHNSDAATYPNIASVTTNSATLVDGSVSYVGDPWLMPAPTADGAHLAYLSSSRGATPVFPLGATVTTTGSTYDTDTKTLKAEVQFSAATCDSNILQYRITIKNAAGAPLVTRWAYGNWVPISDGVLEGATHLDATRFGYSISGISCPTDRFYAEVVAVDEFGNISAPLTSALSTPELPVSEPVYLAGMTNAFDSLAGYHGTNGSPRITFSGSGSSIVTNWNNKDTTSPWDKAHYFLDPVQYSANGLESKKNGWALPYQHPEYFTPYDADDTIAYEADFTISDSNGGYIMFNVREDATFAANNALYTGIRISKTKTELVINNSVKATSTAFGHGIDGKSHHIAVVSAPKKISVWIDGKKIFDEEPYYVTMTDDMTPCMYIWGQNIVGSVSNQKSYLYDPRTAHLDYYAERMSAYIEKINATEGHYATERTDKAAVIAAAEVAIASVEAGTPDVDEVTDAYYAIQEFVSSLVYGNDFFFDGTTALTINDATKPIFTETADGFIFDLSESGYNTIGQTNMDIDYPVTFTGLPFAADENYEVEFDLAVDNHITTFKGTQDMRMIFKVGTINGKNVYVMLQGNTLLTSNSTGGWVNNGQAGGLNIYTDGAAFHVKYTVLGDKTVIVNFSNDSKSFTYTYNIADNFGSDYTLVMTPEIRFKKAAYTVSNLHIGYALSTYTDRMATEITKLEAGEGRYTTDRTDTAAVIAAAKAASAAADNVGTPAKTIVDASTDLHDLFTSIRVPNDFFFDGTVTLSLPTAKTDKAFTPLVDGFIFDLSQAGYTAAGLTDTAEYQIDLNNMPFTTSDTYVVEYDIAVDNKESGQDMRMVYKLGTINGKNVYINLQGNTILTMNSEGGWVNNGAATGFNIHTNGNSFHVKYTVFGDQKVYIDFTKGTTSYHYTYNLSDNFGDSYTLNFAPALRFKKATYTVTGLHIGYDLTSYLSTLQDAVDECDGTDTKACTAESAAAFTEALTEAGQIIANPDRYSKDDILDAAEDLLAAKSALVPVTVLYEYELTGVPTLGGADGSYSISTYYLDANGEKVYLEKNRNSDVAISFESWFLRTMYQYRTVDGQLDVRFVAMLDENIADYAEAGFVYRIDALDWEEKVSTTEVYTSFLASGKEQNIAAYSRDTDCFFLQNTLFSEDVVKENYTVTVYAYLTTKDGNTYHGAPITFDLADLI